MLEKAAKNIVKKSEKIFSKCGKPHGKGVSYLYLIDILIDAWASKAAPLTIAQLIEKIAEREGHTYNRTDIQKAINSIHIYCENIILHNHTVVAGRSRAKAFSINFKTEQLCSG